MIVDYHLLDAEQGLQPHFLTILEQAPGEVEIQDMTPVLQKQGYWGSFNVPNFPTIRKVLGYQDLVKSFAGTAQEFEFDDNKRSIFT